MRFTAENVHCYARRYEELPAVAPDFAGQLAEAAAATANVSGLRKRRPPRPLQWSLVNSVQRCEDGKAHVGRYGN